MVALVFPAALRGQRCPFMESRFPDGPVGAGSTQGSFPGEPLVAMPLSLSFSPNADRIISESCYCLRGEIVGDVTSRDVQSVCLCFGGAANTRLHLGYILKKIRYVCPGNRRQVYACMFI